MTRTLPLLALLAACADIPEVGRAEAALADPGQTPALLTADQLASLTGSTPDLSNALAGEAAALRARADRLRRR